MANFLVIVSHSIEQHLTLGSMIRLTMRFVMIGNCYIYLIESMGFERKTSSKFSIILRSLDSFAKQIFMSTDTLTTA